MTTAVSAKIQLEQGQTLVNYELMTDSGDHQTFTPSGLILSNKEGFAPTIRPNGIVSGNNVVTPDNALVNDTVDIAAFSAYSIGVEYSVGATSTTITRPAGNVAKVNSITMNSSGTIAVVAGTDGGSTTFSETRGAAGGPPLIPVDSVELAQVRVTTTAAAPITADQIFQVVGQHTERYDFPGWTVNALGNGNNATTPSKKNAHVVFDSVLPTIHTGPVARRVYARYYTPVFADLGRTLDFVPAENSHSVNSTQYYGGSVASTSTSLGQASFTTLMGDGTTDSIVSQKDMVVTAKFFPDRNKAAYVLTQGKLGLSRTFPVDDQIQASCTLSAEIPSVEFTS